jgi:hypothetical protein
MPPIERQAFLSLQHVDFVLTGPRERQLGIDPASELAEFERVYHQGEHSIFRVLEP